RKHQRLSVVVDEAHPPQGLVVEDAHAGALGEDLHPRLVEATLAHRGRLFEPHHRPGWGPGRETGRGFGTDPRRGLSTLPDAAPPRHDDGTVEATERSGDVRKSRDRGP